MSSRITAIGAIVLMVLLPLSLCCISAPQHPCCKNRCAMAPDAAPLVATAPAKPRIDALLALAVPSSARAHAAPEVGLAPECVATTAHPRLNPIATIQLRI